jgi:hypothetical protein
LEDRPGKTFVKQAEQNGKGAQEAQVSIGLCSSIEECGLYMDVSVQEEKIKEMGTVSISTWALFARKN